MTIQDKRSEELSLALSRRRQRLARATEFKGKTPLSIIAALALAVFGASSAWASEVRVSDTNQLLRACREAKAGATILLLPGVYRGGISLTGLQGEANRPITIAAADPKRPPVIRGGNSCLHLIDPAHVELRGLVLTGARTNGLNIDDGGSYDTPAHHVVLRDLTVKDVGSDGNHDGIKLSGLDDFRVENCTIQRWGKKGSGVDMVGCHRGAVVDCTLQSAGAELGSGVQMKGGSREITVSYCRFENAGGRAINIGGSTGLPYFRPPPRGYEAKDIIVSDCTFLGSMAPIAFVGVDGAVVRHNTIYRPTRWILRILQENQGPGFVACRKGRFLNNLIAFRSNEIASSVNIGPKTAPQSFQFASNFWFCLDRPERSRQMVRLPVAEQDGVYGVDPKFRDASRGDLRLAPGSPATSRGPRARSKP